MKIGIAVFAYNRNSHLSKTLGGLKSNKEVKEIYVFQDGLKNEGHRIGWEATQKVICGIDWCRVNYILADNNKGIARSIIDGVNYVLSTNDAVVVIEDDCVPASNFISFMVQCFEKYADNKMVYGMSGYSWPINIEQDKFDAYFTGRTSSWGWGTWKDRWENFEIDNHIVERIKLDEKKSLNLSIWGNDLEQMLLDTITGKNDAWDVYWALKVIELGGVFLAPYASLIQNIGWDGTGRHCGKTDRFLVDLDCSEKKKFDLPEDVMPRQETINAFVPLHGSYTAINNNNMNKNVLIYGLGNCYRKYEKELNQKYNVVAFIDRNKSGWFAGKKIISLSEIGEYAYDEIIIMIQNIQECINIAKKLINEYDVNFNQIELYNNIFKDDNGGFHEICILEDGNLSVSYGEITIKVNSLDEYNNVYEGLVKESYHYYINNHKKDIVFDVGMNIGDTTLYFLKNKNVDKVYAYEPFKDTYIRAKYNLKDYLCNQDRIEIFQYGISDVNAKQEIRFNIDMSCGQSTISDVSEDAHRFYENNGLILKENDKSEMIEVRKASDVFMPIIEKHTDNNIVLKMNCEGEEYNIIKDLSQSGVIKSIDFIIMEWHYKGKEVLLEYLRQSDFSYWCSDKNSKMGWIYAYKK